jgi:hypothetical protein
MLKNSEKALIETHCPSPDWNGISRFLENKALAVAFLNREFSG